MNLTTAISRSKKLLIAIGCFLLASQIFGQEIRRSVFASGGDELQGEEITLSMTIGETFTETLNYDFFILSQGFQQGILSKKGKNNEKSEQISSTQDFLNSELSVRIYPNPANDIFYVQLQNNVNEDLNMDIFNICGVKIQSKQLKSDIEQIDISNLAAGCYLVRIYNSNNSNIQSFKLYKI